MDSGNDSWYAQERRTIGGNVSGFKDVDFLSFDSSLNTELGEKHSTNRGNRRIKKIWKRR